MILGFGADLLDVGRVEKELARRGWAADEGIFTPGEICRCGAVPHPASRYAEYFAVKESVIKALGVQPPDLALFREVEVAHCDSQGYQVILHDRLKAASEQLGVKRIKVAVARGAGQGTAVVILED